MIATKQTSKIRKSPNRPTLIINLCPLRFLVASDQNGSPLALFDTNGNIIKEVRRSPFGKVSLDSNPDFYLPIDFQKGRLEYPIVIGYFYLIIT